MKTSRQQLRCRWADHAIYLKDVMDKLPIWPNRRIDELLPHRWQPGHTLYLLQPDLDWLLLAVKMGLPDGYARLHQLRIHTRENTMIQFDAKNLARTMRSVLTSCLLSATIAGCGGGSGQDEGPVQTGTLTTPSAAGLRYQTQSLSGVTGINGSFTYRPGELVSFSVGPTMLGTVQASASVPFRSLFADDTQANRALFYLAALDSQRGDSSLSIAASTQSALSATQPVVFLDANAYTLTSQLAYQSLYSAGALNDPVSTGSAPSPLESIPNILREKKNWSLAADLMDHWFGGSGSDYHLQFNEISSLSKSVQNQVSAIESASASNSAIRQIDFPEFFNQLKLEVEQRSPLLLTSGGRFSFIDKEFSGMGSLFVTKNDEDKLKSTRYFREITFGHDSEPTHMLAAFGDLPMRVVADGVVSISNGIATVTVERVGLYFRDSYDFRGFQVLGCWSTTKEPYIKMSFFELDSSFFCVYNSDFRDYNTTIRGREKTYGEFRIFTDPVDKVFQTRQTFAFRLSDGAAVPVPVQPLPLPGFNSGVALAQITGGISTRWNAATGTVTRYELYRSTSRGTLGSRIYSGTGLTFNDTGLTSGTYYYTAQACNDSGCVSGRQDFFTYR